jgi:RND family efflux transporter MFP subunit
MSKCRIVAATLIVASLAACNKEAPTAAQHRPVRVVTVQDDAAGETVSMTGQVRAKDQASLGFRIDGRMVERLVSVGDPVKAGQVIARLAPQDQENARRSAEAALAAAEAQLTQARLTYGRQQDLAKSGWTPRARLDDAEQAFHTAQAQVDAARARLRQAQDGLGYTVLAADGPGVVTQVGAEAGEVVRPGQMIAQIARPDGRDAVFDVPDQIILKGPKDPLVTIALTNDPTVTATGRVREVAPQADQATRTFQVKVAITDPPAAMRLGSTVTGRISLPPSSGVVIPASALTEADGQPAVWTVDAQSLTVSLHTVGVLRYDPGQVVVSQGVKPGDVVVTAGVQLLHPDQKVRLLEAAR